MLWASYVTIVAIWIVTVVTPGPNFVASVHTALAHGRRAGVLVALGIALGTLIWATSSLAGLSLLFERAQWAYHVIRIAGGLYLVCAGIQLIRTAWRGPGHAPAIRSASIEPLDDGRAFRRGLVVDLANPKAAAHFTSLFAVMVPPAAPLWFDVLLVATAVAIAASWYTAMVVLAGVPLIARAYASARRWITAATGALFATMGLRLAIER